MTTKETTKATAKATTKTAIKCAYVKLATCSIRANASSSSLPLNLTLAKTCSNVVQKVVQELISFKARLSRGNLKAAENFSEALSELHDSPILIAIVSTFSFEELFSKKIQMNLVELSANAHRRTLHNR